jgi:hypothetical protein
MAKAKKPAHDFVAEYIKAYNNRTFDVTEKDITGTRIDYSRPIRRAFASATKQDATDDNLMSTYFGLRNIALTNAYLGFEKGYPRLFVSWSDSDKVPPIPIGYKLADYNVIVIQQKGEVYIYTRKSLIYSDKLRATYNYCSFGATTPAPNMVLQSVFENTITEGVEVVVADGDKYSLNVPYYNSILLLTVDSLSRGGFSVDCQEAAKNVHNVFRNLIPISSPEANNAVGRFFLFAFATEKFLFTEPSGTFVRISCLPNPRNMALIAYDK